MRSKEELLALISKGGLLGPTGAGIGKHTDELLRLVVELLLDIREKKGGK